METTTTTHGLSDLAMVLQPLGETAAMESGGGGGVYNHAYACLMRRDINRDYADACPVCIFDLIEKMLNASEKN